MGKFSDIACSIILWPGVGIFMPKDSIVTKLPFGARGPVWYGILE